MIMHEIFTLKMQNGDGTAAFCTISMAQLSEHLCYAQGMSERRIVLCKSAVSFLLVIGEPTYLGLPQS